MKLPGFKIIKQCIGFMISVINSLRYRSEYMLKGRCRIALPSNDKTEVICCSGISNAFVTTARSDLYRFDFQTFRLCKIRELGKDAFYKIWRSANRKEYLVWGYDDDLTLGGSFFANLNNDLKFDSELAGYFYDHAIWETAINDDQSKILCVSFERLQIIDLAEFREIINKEVLGIRRVCCYDPYNCRFYYSTGGKSKVSIYELSENCDISKLVYSYDNSAQFKSFSVYRNQLCLTHKEEATQGIDLISGKVLWEFNGGHLFVCADLVQLGVWILFGPSSKISIVSMFGELIETISLEQFNDDSIRAVWSVSVPSPKTMIVHCGILVNFFLVLDVERMIGKDKLNAVCKRVQSLH